MNIVESIVVAGSYKKLALAIGAAAMVEELTRPTPLTLFAPIDGAFDRMPAYTFESLLQLENQATLAEILRFHVVPCCLELTNLAESRSVMTLSGRLLDLGQPGEVSIGGANLVTPKVPCDHGVMYGIDRLLVPSVALEVEPL